MTLTSDPHAWLRPIYAALRKDPSFLYLSPSHQFDAVVAAITDEHPSRAAAMREWSPATQEPFLKWLRDVTDEQPPVQEMELWRVRKGARELQCVAVYLPTGIDVRLMEWPRGAGLPQRRGRMRRRLHARLRLAGHLY